jgi:hypothetical protein
MFGFAMIPLASLPIQYDLTRTHTCTNFSRIGSRNCETDVILVHNFIYNKFWKVLNHAEQAQCNRSKQSVIFNSQFAIIWFWGAQTANKQVPLGDAVILTQN